MRRSVVFGFIIAAALVFGSGCMSFSTLHTAKPVEQGRTQITLAPNIGDGNTGLSGLGLPSAEIAGRHGLAKNMDVGAKLFLPGVAFDLNYALINDPNFAFSVNPYLSVTRMSASATNEEGDSASVSATWGTFLVNLLADVVSTDSMAVTLGLKPGFIYAIGSASAESGGTSESATEAATGAVIGGMAGVTLRLSDTFAIMPTIDVLMPIENFGNGYMYNGALAVQF